MLALLLVAAAQPVDVESAVAHYRTVTTGAVYCHVDRDTTDVTVCGRRDADRYRVPLIEPNAGNPKTEGVPAERERMLARTSNCQEKSIFLVGCGEMGVSAKASFGPDGIHGAHLRPLAP